MDGNGQSHSSNLKEQARFGYTRDADNFLSKIFQIWEKLGMDENQKKTRAETARVHVKNLMQKMIDEEEVLMARVISTITEFTEKLNKLCEELCSNPIKIPGDMTMVQKEKYLRTKVDTLNKEKTDRLAKYKELHDEDQKLCDTLSATPYYLPTGAVPSQEQLRECEKHVNQLKAEKDKRFSQFVDSKRKIVNLHNLMGTDPETSFAHDLVCEEDNEFKLSTRNMEQLKSLLESLTMLNDEMLTETEDLWERLRALWNRLEISDIDREAFEENKEGHGKAVMDALKAEIEACEKLKFENMRKFIDGIRNELKTWWDKCHYSKEQRNKFKEINNDECTEELLAAHETELETVRKYYSQARELFEKLEHRKELFEKMMVMEEAANDPNRYNNRGGKLLQEEKARKKVLKELPKVEDEIKISVEKWETERGRQFRLDGLNYSQFIEQEWNNFHIHKEQQKQSRLQARAKQTHDEMLYGTKNVSCTPNKRKAPLAATPIRTPLKTRKINDVLRTPNTTSKLTNSSRLPNNSRFQHSTMISSPFSRQPLYTPKTPNNAASRKRRSIRLIEKAATERRVTTNRRKSRENTFSMSTVSGDDHAVSTLASHGSYTDFAKGLNKPDCRSSVMPGSITPLHVKD